MKTKIADVSVQKISESVRVLTDFKTREVRIEENRPTGWETIRKFNYMSDTYAFSNAKIQAIGHARKIGEIS